MGYMGELKTLLNGTEGWDVVACLQSKVDYDAREFSVDGRLAACGDMQNVTSWAGMTSSVQLRTLLGRHRPASNSRLFRSVVEVLGSDPGFRVHLDAGASVDAISQACSRVICSVTRDCPVLMVVETVLPLQHH